MLYTIYKIVCKTDASLVYVGSTKNYNSRISIHKYYANRNEKDFLIYQSIRANGGWDNWDCSPVEHLECETRNQAIMREGHYIVELNASLNMAVINHTVELKKESFARASKKYNDAHKEEIKEKRRLKEQTPEEQARLFEYRTRPEVRDRINQQRRERRAKAKEENIIV